MPPYIRGGAAQLSRGGGRCAARTVACIANRRLHARKQPPYPECHTADARSVSVDARSRVLAARIRSIRVLRRRRGNRLPVSRAIARRTRARDDRVHCRELLRLATVSQARIGAILSFLFADFDFRCHAILG